MRQSKSGQVTIHRKTLAFFAVSSHASLSRGKRIPLAPADIFYVGVAPCCAGLYQLVVKIPDTAPDGNLRVVVTINGIPSPFGPFIAVARG